MLLLAMPPLLFVGMGVQPMARVQSIDPTLYTAYIDNGPDLIQRFGTDRYYWSRVGTVLPGRLGNLVLGPVGGFYLFRFALALVAIVPAYLLFRRLWDERVGLVAAVVLLVNPVAIRAWTSDYPDGAAIAYLVGGTCFLLYPSHRRRWAWSLAAGAMFAAAVLCNVVVSALVAATLAADAVVRLRPLTRAAVPPMLRHWLVIGTAFVATAFAFAVGAELVIGAGNLVHPTVRAIQEMRGDQFTPYHSSNWRWVLRETQLMVPPLLLMSWGALRLRRRDDEHLPAAESTVALAVAFQTAGFALWQFVNRGSTLENYLYSSLLWATTSLLAVFVLRALWARQAVRRWVLLCIPVVLLVPLGLRSFAPDLQFRLWPWGPAVILVVTVVLLLATRRATPATVLRSLGLTLVIVVAAQSLTIAKPQNLPFLAGQAIHPQASYGDVFLNSDDTYLETYRVVTQLPDLVPSLERTAGDLLLWWSSDAPDIVQYAAAMYLWRNTALMGFDFDAPGLPVLGSAELQRLQENPPRFILMLGADSSRFDSGLTSLDDAGVRPEIQSDEVLRSGDSQLSVRLVELGTWFEHNEGDGDGNS